MEELTATHFLLLSGALFVIGMMGVLTRRNVLVIFMSVELMINGVSVAFVGFAWEMNSAYRAGVRAVHHCRRRG